MLEAASPALHLPHVDLKSPEWCYFLSSARALPNNPHLVSCCPHDLYQLVRPCRPFFHAQAQAATLCSCGHPCQTAKGTREFYFDGWCLQLTSSTHPEFCRTESEHFLPQQILRLLIWVLQALGINSDYSSVPGRVYVPQCPQFSQALNETWAKVNTRLSSQAVAGVGPLCCLMRSLDWKNTPPCTP